MISIDYVKEIFDSKQNENFYILDHYPYQILNNKKYSQIDCSHKNKSFNRNIKKEQEDSLIKFFIDMWLYSDMYSYVFNYSISDRTTLLYKKMKKTIVYDEFFLIEDFNVIQDIINLVFRESTSTYIVFENFLMKWNIYVYLFGNSGYIYFDDEMAKCSVEKIVNSCGLFLRLN